MNYQNLRNELIEYLQVNGKTHSWVELYEMFPFKGDNISNKRKSDFVRNIYKRKLKTEHHAELFMAEAAVKRVKVWDRPDGTKGTSIQYEVAKQQDLEQIKELKSALIESIKTLKKPTINKLARSTSEKIPVAYEISLPDFHFGKFTGETIEQQKRLFLAAIEELMRKASGFAIDRIILPIGNDLLNSEGLRQATTRGTPQHDNCDWKESFRVAWTSVLEAINYLSQFAPVHVICVHGNHDYERSFYIGELLSAYYSNSEIVVVDNNYSSRKYYKYGNVILGYTHGDKEKPHELPLIMATEVPIEFASSKHRAWRLGHLHKHMHDEYRGVSVTFLPSLCGNDEWHNNMGYQSLRKAQGYVWNKNSGLEGYIQINYE